MKESTIKNYVFLSYNHNDVKWAKWLQKKLEWYRLPHGIHNKCSNSRYIRPVFRDNDTLTAGILNDELLKQLEASEHLVVICSPNSAQAEWVSKEVQTFIDMGRIQQIVPFIVEGTPQDYAHSDINQPLLNECYPKALRTWNANHPDKQLLGITINDEGKINRQKAFIKLAAHLLKIDFDKLWQRHKRYIIRIISSIICFTILALLLAYWFMIPIKMSVTIQDEHTTLPGMEHAILNVNGSEYSLSQPDTTIEIGKIPGYLRLTCIPISFHADRFYTDEKITLRMSAGFSQKVKIQLHRDSTFAIFEGNVYNGNKNDYESYPISDAIITLGQHQVTTDDSGHFRIELTLAEQRENLPIKISKDGFQTFTRQDESPNSSLKYLLYH